MFSSIENNSMSIPRKLKFIFVLKSTKNRTADNLHRIVGHKWLFCNPCCFVIVHICIISCPFRYPMEHRIEPMNPYPKKLMWENPKFPMQGLVLCHWHLLRSEYYIHTHSKYFCKIRKIELVRLSNHLHGYKFQGGSAWRIAGKLKKKHKKFLLQYFYTKSFEHPARVL